MRLRGGGRGPQRDGLLRWQRDGSRAERGAASLLVLAIGLAFVFAGVVSAAVGAARIGRHRAHIAADLGAMAGGQQAVHGEATACATAAHYVVANGGRMTACDVDGLEIVVRVRLAVTPLPGMTRYAAAAARAGPVYSW